MSRLSSLLLHVLASLIAFVIMLGLLLSIAYFHELYTPPPKERIPLMAITGAMLIDGTDRGPASKATVIIGSDRILSVQRNGSLPQDAQLLQANGLYLMPALIDAAVYLEAPTASEVDLISGEWAWEVTRSLPEHRRALLEAGVTTVQDLAGGLDSIVRTRALLQEGDLAGPRLMIAGPVLTAAGGFPGADQFPNRLEELTRPVQTPAEGRRWVQELASRAVDHVSVSYTSLGGRYPRLALEALVAVITEARAFGLRVLVHTASLDEARQATAAGADALVGGVTLTGEQVDGDLLRLMQERGTVYIPTLAAVQARQAESSTAESLSSAQLNAWLVHQAGVPVVAGSGTVGRGMHYGDSLWRELGLLVEAGLTPTAALSAATREAANWLGLQARLGTVEEGKLADLLILGADPTLDIQALSQVRGVIQNGMLVINGFVEP